MQVLTITELLQKFFEVALGWVVYVLVGGPMGAALIRWAEPVLTFVGLNESQQKRSWAIALAVVIAAAVYVPAVLLGYLPQPESWLGGVLGAAGITFASSQVVHMVRKLGRDD